jgi:hypothetical protein
MSDDLGQIIATCKETNTDPENEDMLPGTSNTEAERKETNIDADNEDMVPVADNEDMVPVADNEDMVPVADNEDMVPVADNEDMVPVADNEDMVPVTSNTGDEQTSASVAAPTAVPNKITGELINLIYIRNILKLKLIFELKKVIFNSLVCNLTSLWHSWIQLVGV